MRGGDVARGQVAAVVPDPHVYLHKTFALVSRPFFMGREGRVWV